MIIQRGTDCTSNKILPHKNSEITIAANHFFPSLSLIFITKITSHFDRTDKLKVGGGRHLQIHTRKNIALWSLSISFWGIGCFWTAQWWWRGSNCPLGFLPWNPKLHSCHQVCSEFYEIRNITTVARGAHSHLNVHQCKHNLFSLQNFS
jgi:hypothetical protein